MGKLETTLKSIGDLDTDVMDEARRRLDRLTKPQGSLGRLEELAVHIAGITKNPRPKIDRKSVIVMAADHGVAAEGVSAYPKEVTAQMVLNFLSGGAAINVLARHIGAHITVVDIGVAEDIEHPNLVVRKIAYGTKNIAKQPAMSREEATEALNTGIDVFYEQHKRGLDAVVVGDMGIANTTPSAAVICAITGEPAERIVGRGTGIDNARLTRKIEVVEEALSLHKPDPEDGIDVLSKVGGFEIGGLAGVVLAAAAERIPTLLDGFISTAAALIAYKLNPKVRNFLIAGHLSTEAGHRTALQYLDLKPLLALDMRLGEGTGATLALNIVEAALKILDEMATFDEAGVSEKTE